MAELTNNTNYVTANGFRVRCSHKDFKNLEYFAQTVSHPSMDVAESTIPFKGINLPVSGDKITYAPVTMIFLLDEDMKSYIEIQEWLLRLACANQVSAADALIAEGKYPTECDISVSPLTSHNNINKIFTYHGAFPTNLGGIELSSTQEGGEFLTFDATFKFAYYTIK